jgi:hypothetical protein
MRDRTEITTSVGSTLQNGYAARLIGPVRLGSAGHLIVFNTRNIFDEIRAGSGADHNKA